MNMFEALNLMANSNKSSEQIAMELLRENPQANQFLKQVNNMRGKQSMKDFTLQIAKQRGIDPKQLEEVARRLGAK